MPCRDLVNVKEFPMHQPLPTCENTLLAIKTHAIIIGSETDTSSPGERLRHQPSLAEAICPDAENMSHIVTKPEIIDPTPKVAPVLLPIAPVPGINRSNNKIGDYKPRIALYIGKQEIAAGMKKIQKDDPYEIVELLYFDGPQTSTEIRNRKNLTLSDANHVLTALQQGNIVSRIDTEYYITTFGRELMEGLACIMEKIETRAIELGSDMAT